MKRRRYNFWNCGGYNYFPYGWISMEEFFQNNSKAIDILKVRYAKGEISYEEFNKMKNDIS